MILCILYECLHCMLTLNDGKLAHTWWLLPRLHEIHFNLLQEQRDTKWIAHKSDPTIGINQMFVWCIIWHSCQVVGMRPFHSNTKSIASKRATWQLNQTNFAFQPEHGTRFTLLNAVNIKFECNRTIHVLHAIDMGKEECKNVRVAELNHHFSTQTSQTNKQTLPVKYVQTNKQTFLLTQCQCTNIYPFQAIMCTLLRVEIYIR